MRQIEKESAQMTGRAPKKNLAIMGKASSESDSMPAA